jgi:hypothetical protein
LLGGGAEHDLSPWRDCTVECRLCGEKTPATDARTIDLSTLSPRAEAQENCVEQPTRV